MFLMVKIACVRYECVRYDDLPYFASLFIFAEKKLSNYCVLNLESSARSHEVAHFTHISAGCLTRNTIFTFTITTNHSSIWSIFHVRLVQEHCSLRSQNGKVA